MTPKIEKTETKTETAEINWAELEQQLSQQIKQQIRESGGLPYLRPREGENKLELITDQKPAQEQGQRGIRYSVKVKNLDDNQLYILTCSPTLLQKIIRNYMDTRNPKFVLIRVGQGQQTRYSVKPI